jgi:hypothetical protein
MTISQVDIQSALAEITSQTPEQIEEATAIKWGARALAAWALAQGTSNTATRSFWAKEATLYKHEAVEHAAWGPPGLLESIRAQLIGVP